MYNVHSGNNIIYIYIIWPGCYWRYPSKKEIQKRIWHEDNSIWNMLLNVFKTVIIVISTLLGRLLPVPFLICTSDKQTRLTFRLNYKMLQAWNYSVVFTSMVCTKLSLQPLMTTVYTKRCLGIAVINLWVIFAKGSLRDPALYFGPWILSLCYAQRPFGLRCHVPVPVPPGRVTH